jgi:heat shock protein HtpX
VFAAAAANKRNTFILLSMFILAVSGVAIWVGFLFEAVWIPILVVIYLLVFTAVQYRFASREIMHLIGALPVKRSEQAELWKLVENLSIREGLPMPRLYLIFDSAPNALAAGTSPDKAVIAVTSGLLELLSKAELEAVLAHEFGHIKNYDIRVKTVVFGLLGAVAFIALMGWTLVSSSMASTQAAAGGKNPVGAISISLGIIGAAVAAVAGLLSHVLGPLVRAAISRQREYLADASAVETTRQPKALIAALEKLGDAGQKLARAQPSTAHLFFTSPLRGRVATFFTATHPSIQKRIERIRQIGTSLR